MERVLFWKKFVIKKVIWIAIIVIAAIALGIIWPATAGATSGTAAAVAMEQAKGGTVFDAQATSAAMGGIISIGRVIAQVAIFLFSFVFLFDTGIDLWKYFRKEENIIQGVKE